MKNFKKFSENVDKIAKQNNPDIYDDLNPHLKDTASKLSEVVVKHGKYSRNMVSAHYVDESPFKENNIICNNCLFFDGKDSCSIVEGKINSDGICRFRVIPKDIVKE